MCGIGGMFNYREAPLVEMESLLRIREAMYARGPDGAGLWMDEKSRVGLVHRRLAILDLSEAGAQPMMDPDTNNVIVFNGEIYNYQYLRQELMEQGCTFRSSSDTEVILYLYRRDGIGFLDRLRGMYALAIWDPFRGTLTLARDPLGIKPLYYADDGHTLRFTSQVKALAAGGGVNTAPSPAGWVGYYLWGHIPEPFTTCEGIHSLPPGGVLRVVQGGAPNVSSTRRPLDNLRSNTSKRDAPMPLHDILVDSIRHHLIADVPIGIFLSAGIDSAVISALVAETAPAALPRAITLGFAEYRGSENDEVPLATMTARHYGLQHSVHWVSRQDFKDALPHFLASMDQPTTDGLNTWFVAKVTRDSGFKVALSGVGGDEIFGGYPSFRQIPLAVRRLGWCPPALGRGFRWLAAPIIKHLTSPKYAGVFEYGGSSTGAYLLRRGMYMPWELPKLLDADFVRRGWQQLNTMSALAQTIEQMPNDRCRVMALETEWYLQSRLLRDTDWTGMAHSLEIRTPLVDIDVTRNLDAWWRQPQHAQPTKRTFALVPKRPLLKEIINRPKTGFSIPVREWLLTAQGKNEHGERGLRDWARFVAKNCMLPGV